jgi:predicted RNase H-like HicB family nuclease
MLIVIEDIEHGSFTVISQETPAVSSQGDTFGEAVANFFQNLWIYEE